VARIPSPADLLAQMQAQTEAMAQLPLTVTQLHRAIGDLTSAIGAMRETVASAQRVSEQLESVIAELEAPVRALRPGLARAARVLDDPVVETLPDTLRRLQDAVLPVAEGLHHTQSRLDQAATTVARLGELPGLSRIGRRRRIQVGSEGE
jgi:ABC-type transporter Mla subunit MlaD